MLQPEADLAPVNACCRAADEEGENYGYESR